MRAILVGLLLTALAAVACSDRVPAPVTPSPSPQPGYPPAALTQVPEGVLYVQKAEALTPPVVAPSMFGLNRKGESHLSVSAWMVSVSPDGRHAAVLANRERMIDGIGILTRLQYETVVEGRWAPGTVALMWSGDGRRLAYTLPEDGPASKSHVWTLDVEIGEKRQLTSRADIYALVGWTAAGEVLAMTPHGLSLLGEGERELELPEKGEVIDLEISSNGQTVAVLLGSYEHSPADELTYVHSIGIWIGGFGAADWRKVADLTGEPPAVLLTIPPEMRWSADDRWITTHSTRRDEQGIIQNGLSVIDGRNGEVVWVSEKGSGRESWSLDGRSLAYVYEVTNVAGRSAGRRLGILGPDGRVREADLVPRGMAWTKDGQLLLDIPGHLSLLDPETMSVDEVTTQDGESISVLLDYSGVWSPSGRYLAASTQGDAYHRSSLYIVDTEEGTARVLFEESDFATVAWLRE